MSEQVGGDGGRLSSAPSSPSIMGSRSGVVPPETDCSEALLRVYEFLDGELGPDECAKIQAHLDACGPCLKEYDLDTTLKALVKRSCECEQAPDTLRTTIMTRISMTVFRLEG